MHLSKSSLAASIGLSRPLTLVNLSTQALSNGLACVFEQKSDKAQPIWYLCVPAMQRSYSALFAQQVVLARFVSIFAARLYALLDKQEEHVIANNKATKRAFINA